MKNKIYMIAIFLLIIVPNASLMATPKDTLATSVQVTPGVVREGKDFATSVLGDAWDMNAFSDISKYYNTSGADVTLSSPTFTDGIFSATTLKSNPTFDALFSGFGSAIMVGKYGVNYPIKTNTYHCYRVMMKSNFTGTQDTTRFWWFTDSMTGGAGNYGYTPNINITTPSTWTLLSGDLNAAGGGYEAYTAKTQWQGIRFSPSYKTGTTFQIDWMRITDCTPVNVTFSWQGSSGSGSVWMAKDTATPLLNLGSVSGGSGTKTIDVQGWEAGEYYIGLKESGGTTWATLSIDPAPQVTFKRPSADSGASLYWPMNSPGEFSPGVPLCMTYTLSNGTLLMNTAGPGNQPSNCVMSGSSDPKIKMNLGTTPVYTSAYRYLSYRLKQDGAYMNVNTGWINRWVWTTYLNNDPNQWCYGVLNDVPYDVSWETYLLDMHDPAVGTPEDGDGYDTATCLAQKGTWSTRDIYELRFDPNENTTSQSFVQYLDYVRLSKPDQGHIGTDFRFEIGLSESFHDVTFQFYYTSDPDLPKQHVLNLATQAGPPGGSFRSFLPLVTSSRDFASFYWDTSGVSIGSYYLCAEATDGAGNVTLRCSDTIVELTNP
jgi:hypothetical protein